MFCNLIFSYIKRITFNTKLQGEVTPMRAVALKAREDSSSEVPFIVLDVETR